MPDTRGLPFDQFLATAEAVAKARPEVDLELARELFLEAATLLHNGLALDGLDEHDAGAVVAGLCLESRRQGSRRRCARPFPGHVAGAWRSARPGGCVRGLPDLGGDPATLRNGRGERLRRKRLHHVPWLD